MATQRTHTAPAGPIALDLTQSTGRIAITVDPDALQSTVTVRTTADSGPVADAVNSAEILQQAQRLTIDIPQTPGNHGSTVIQSGGSVFNFSGGASFNGISFGGSRGRIIVNGVDVTEAVKAGGGQAPAEVETTVVLTVGSWIELKTHSATSTIRGQIASLDYDGSSGSVTVDRVGTLRLRMTSGNAQIGTVTDQLDADLTSGNFTVAAYSGNDARLRVTSGNLRLAATPASQGRFQVNMTSGTGQITGTGHLQVSRRVTSGMLRVA